MKPIIIYYRVSTDRQGKSGLGLAAQRVACEQFAHNHGYEISAEFREVETGKGADALDRRPQLAAALAMAKKLKCPVLVGKHVPVPRCRLHCGPDGQESSLGHVSILILGRKMAHPTGFEPVTSASGGQM